MLRRKSRRFIVWFPQFSPRLLIPVTNKIVSPSKLTCLTCACLRTLLIGWKIPRNKSRFSGYYLYSVIMPLSLSTAIYSLLMLIQSPFYRMGIYNSKYKGFQNHLGWTTDRRTNQPTDKQTNQLTDLSVYMEVTLPVMIKGSNNSIPDAFKSLLYFVQFFNR